MPTLDLSSGAAIGFLSTDLGGLLLKNTPRSLQRPLPAIGRWSYKCLLRLSRSAVASMTEAFIARAGTSAMSICLKMLEHLDIECYCTSALSTTVRRSG